jgi:hypothetical protein
VREDFALPVSEEDHLLVVGQVDGLGSLALSDADGSVAGQIVHLGLLLDDGPVLCLDSVAT